MGDLWSSGTDNGGDDESDLATITVNITAVNDAPLIDAVSDPSAILEDASQQQITLTGLADGDPELSQSLTISATSSNTDIIPNPSYNASNNKISYTPVSDANGTVTITVTVDDGGGTSNGGDESTSIEFDVEVTLSPLLN